jgi:hypothetical protein
MAGGRRRLTYRPRKSDFMFLLGAGIIIGEVGNEVSDRATLVTGLILMGVPVANRLILPKNGNGKKGTP